MSEPRERVLPAGARWPFVLLASCFLWWAIANNLTDPLVKVFQQTFVMSTFMASLIQFAFYGGYFCLALPGAMIARKFTYKTGVLLGLGAYALGCFLLYPAKMAEEFSLFCLAYFVLAGGLSILETNANPYVLALGSEKTATRRLNFAQSFNPIGAVIGIMLCRSLVMARLPKDAQGNLSIGPEQISDSLHTVVFPYLVIAIILGVVWLLILMTKMPYAAEHDKHLHFFSTTGRLLRNRNYVFSVFAQFCYVGTQITVWTYTNYYIPEQLGVTQEVALVYHTMALVLFGCMRWVFTGLMTFFRGSTLLIAAASLGFLSILCVVFVGGMPGSNSPCLRIRLHVSHVPDHLRAGLLRFGRGHQTGRIGPDHGHRGRGNHYSHSRFPGRPVGCQPILLAARPLFRHHRTLRTFQPVPGSHVPRGDDGSAIGRWMMCSSAAETTSHHFHVGVK